MEERFRAQLEALRAVSADLTRELDLDRLLDRVIREAVGLIGGCSGAVWLWDPAAEHLTPGVFLGFDPAWFAPIRLRLGEGIAGTVAERREGLIVPDRATSPYLAPPSPGRRLPRPSWRSRSSTRTAWSGPSPWTGGRPIRPSPRRTRPSSASSPSRPPSRSRTPGSTPPPSRPRPSWSARSSSGAWARWLRASPTT